MKHIFTILFVVLLVTANSQITQRCPVCPPKLTGVPDGWCLKDSAGRAVWQPCDSGTVGTGTPTQVTYFDASGYITGDEGFTRTELTTAIGNAVGDTFVWQGNGRELYTTFSVPQTVTAGSVITDNTNFASTAYNSRNGFWLGDHIYGTGYFMPKADGTNHQAIITNGAGQSSWQQISYSWLADTPTIPTVPTTIPFDSVTGKPTFLLTASSGLSYSASDVKLGGSLTQATTIDIDTFSLRFSGDGGLSIGKSGAYDTALIFNGTTVRVDVSDETNFISNSFISTTKGQGFAFIDSNANQPYKWLLNGGIPNSGDVFGGMYIRKEQDWEAGYGTLISSGIPKAQLFYGALDANNAITDIARIEANPTAAHGRFITDTATGQYNGWHVGADYAQLEFAKTGEDGQASGINLTVDSSGVSIINAGSLAFKVNTTGSKISAPNIPAYANNTAAVAAIGAGKLYYTDESGEYVLKLSH